MIGLDSTFVRAVGLAGASAAGRAVDRDVNRPAGRVRRRGRLGPPSRLSRAGVIGLRACLLAALLAATPGLAQAAGACRDNQIDLRGPHGAARFVVEIADDPEERARGLMFREKMAASAGMLFLFDPPRQVSFWMKNTPLSLDLIFLDARGRVLNVIAKATPYSESLLPSEGAARAVLEINGGLAARYGIEAGAEARHPGFGADAAWGC